MSQKSYYVHQENNISIYEIENDDLGIQHVLEIRNNDNSVVTDILPILYTGYLLGYLTFNKVTEWADKQLLLNTDTVPDELLIDISLCIDDHAMLSLLSEFGSDNMYLGFTELFPLYFFKFQAASPTRGKMSIIILEYNFLKDIRLF